ncbi:10926_t:CDS:2 [Rhizophagus irregularis]|nr:10926_t:CDS:2 [Rhizophagus irregularis]
MSKNLIEEIQIIYIVWGIFTETIPRNLNPKIGSNGNIYLLSNDHILRLNDGNEERSIVRQPAYEEVTYREIEGEKSLSERKQQFATFVNGIRDNYEIDKKLFGIDAAIALVDDPDKKQSINPKDVAIPESEFKLRSLKPIVLSGIRDVNLIETSDCVFKVGRSGSITFRLSDYLSGPDRIRDEKRLNLKASRALSECEERHFRKDRRVRENGIRPDRQEARTWRKERNRKMCTPSVHIETNNGNVSGTTNGGAFFAGLERDVSKKRKYQENANEIAEDAILIIPILQASMSKYIIFE